MSLKLSSHSYVIQPQAGMRAQGTYRVVVSDGVVTSACSLEGDQPGLPVDLEFDADGLLVHLEIDRQPDLRIVG